jgi:hypothetical protein
MIYIKHDGIVCFAFHKVSVAETAMSLMAKDPDLCGYYLDYDDHIVGLMVAAWAEREGSSERKALQMEVRQFFDVGGGTLTVTDWRRIQRKTETKVARMVADVQARAHVEGA